MARRPKSAHCPSSLRLPGSAAANGTGLPSLSPSAATGSATGAATASPHLPSASLCTNWGGNRIGDHGGSLAPLSLTATVGSASTGGAVLATGGISPIVLSAPSGYATGASTASCALAEILLTSPLGKCPGQRQSLPDAELAGSGLSNSQGPHH